MATITNVFPDPAARYSGAAKMETNNAGTVAFTTTAPIEGDSSYQATFTSTANGSIRSRHVDRGAAAPGQRWFARATIKNLATTSRQFTFALVGWTAVPGATAGSSVATGASSTVTLAAGEIREVLVVLESAPATVQSMGIVFTRTSAVTPAAGDQALIDKIMFGQLPADLAPPEFGYPRSAPGRWFWSGLADNSQTFMPITLPKLTPLLDDNPSPRVQIEFGAFLPGTTKLTVLRTIDGETKPVAGYEEITVTSSFLGWDYYPPQRATVSYQAQMIGANGPIAYTELVSTFVDDGRTLIQSPSDPRKVVAVDLLGSAAGVLTETNLGAVHQIGNERVLIASGGTGLDDLDMSFYTTTLDQYRKALAVFRDAKGLVVIRTPPPIAVPRVLYLWSPKPSRMEVNLPAAIEEFDWNNSGPQVSAPSARVVAAVVTLGQYKAFYPTLGAFKAAYSTIRAARLNPPPAV